MLDSFIKPNPAGLPRASSPSARLRSRPGFLSSVVNVVLYQAGWFGCVLAAAAGRPGLAMGAALVPVLIHLALTPDRGREAQLTLFTGLLGLVIDTITVQIGIFRFPALLGPSGLAPLWIVAMWVQFGMTFHYCFSWLSRRYWLSAGLGAVGGPLSFLAGARLGAVEILAPTSTHLAILALLWGVAMPLMVAAADRLMPRSGEPGIYRFESGVMERRAREAASGTRKLLAYDNR